MSGSDFLGMLSPEFLGCSALVVKGSVHIRSEIHQEAMYLLSPHQSERDRLEEAGQPTADVQSLCSRGPPSQGNGQAQRWHLCFLGDIQHQLELLGHGQIFLRRFLQSKGRENFPLEFNSSDELLTTQLEDSRP